MADPGRTVRADTLPWLSVLRQAALPDNWNGKLVVFSRGFSGTELTPGVFKTTALEKGYAFAASDEGWNRLTIAKEPEDSYYESRQRVREIGAQLDALEQWIDYRESRGKRGAAAPESIGGYPRGLGRASVSATR